jgi:hypothetical protein
MKNLKKLILLTILTCSAAQLFAQRASWIWYPGDFDIYMSNVMQNRRTERASFFPVFWKMDSHYVLVDFHKEFNLTQAEEVKLFVEGTYNVKIDGQAIAGFPKSIQIPAGKHKLSLKVYNQANVPAIFVQGKTVVSDETWLTTFEDKEWIDASGKTSDKSGTTFVSAGTWNLTDPTKLPSQFKLPVVAQSAIKTEKVNKGAVSDFGKETFGFIKVHGLKGKGRLSIYYGESREEALSTDKCETLDYLDIDLSQKKDSIMPLSKAFRYVNYQADGNVSADSVSMLYEYAPVTERGSFKCSKIYLSFKYPRILYRWDKTRPLGVEWRCLSKLPDELLFFL